MRTEYEGQRIYQRDDLVNPAYVSPADKYGRSNLKRMKQGLAPMGPDDKPLNLHHMLQTQDGPIAAAGGAPYSAKTVKGCWYGSSNIRQDVPKLIELHKSGQLKLEELVSREIGVERVNEAFTAMQQGDVARSLIIHKH